MERHGDQRHGDQRHGDRGFRALAAALLVAAAGGISGPAGAARWEAAPSTPSAAIRPVEPSAAAPMIAPPPIAAMRKPANAPLAPPRPAAATPAAPPGPTGGSGLPGAATPKSKNSPPAPSGPDAPTLAEPDAPTLANARWLGFTPASWPGEDTAPGAWIAGPFGGDGQIGWVTDISTGRTVQVSFRWRQAPADDHAADHVATLSREAAMALGLAPGEIANLALYLPR